MSFKVDSLYDHEHLYGIVVVGCKISQEPIHGFRGCVSVREGIHWKYNQEWANYVMVF